MSEPTHFTGSIPENYDRFLGPHIFETHARDLASRIDRLRPRRVLELAAGTGIVSRLLRDTLAVDAHLVVTDLNPPMLEVARTKFGDDESVSFQPADALDLPFDHDTFDAAVCQFGVMFFPNKRVAHSEVLRTLEPGGVYLFNTWSSWVDNPFARVAFELAADLYPDDPPTFYEVPFDYHDPVEIQEALEAAGFVDVSVEAVAATAPLRSAADFARGLVFGNPLIQEIEERGGDPAAIHRAMTKAVTQRLGSELALKALVATARKPR